MAKVAMTVDAARMAPIVAQDQIDTLNAEIEELSKKRKDMKRFLDIDKEKKQLEKVKDDAARIHDRAVKEALGIVDDAKRDAFKEREEALEYKKRSKAYSDRLIKAAKKKDSDAEIRLEIAESRIKDAETQEGKLNEKVIQYAEMVKKFKSDLIRLLKTVDSMES